MAGYPRRGASAVRPRCARSARMRGAPNLDKSQETPPGKARSGIGRRPSPSNSTAFRLVPWASCPQPASCTSHHPVPSPVKCTGRRVVSARGYPHPIALRDLRRNIGRRGPSLHRRLSGRHRKAPSGRPRRHPHHSNAQRFESPRGRLSTSVRPGSNGRAPSCRVIRQSTE